MRFAYDGSDIIGQYDGSGTLLRRYVHGPDDHEPLAPRRRSGKLREKSDRHPR